MGERRRQPRHTECRKAVGQKRKIVSLADARLAAARPIALEMDSLSNKSFASAAEAFLLKPPTLISQFLFRIGGHCMAKKAKRRAWDTAEVRELKSLAKKKTPAGTIAKKLKRSEGATRQKAFSLGLSLDSRG
jgi:hypothetical protein